MPPRSFDTLLKLVAPRIRKVDTRLRKAIPPEHRLALAVRFLAAGETIRTSSFNFLAGRSTACGIVSDVCQAIWEVLGPLYVMYPSSAAEWLKVANEFELRWNMPHCIRAIDGKHFVTECPANTGSQNRNYKGSFSHSLLAISDANYKFLYVEVGHYGSESDGGVFGRSKLLELIEASKMGIPRDSEIGNIGAMPYFFVGDEAFPLKTFMMRPYSRKCKSLKSFSKPFVLCVLVVPLPFLFASFIYARFMLCNAALPSLFSDTSDDHQAFEERHKKRIFNYRLSRARRVVENAFGIMAQRWRILRRPFKAKEENIRKIVSACVTLHNFLLCESPASRAAYCPPGSADTEDWQGQLTEGNWRAEGGTGNALSAISSSGCRSTRYW
ncbi:uncharacterized protein LOC119402951 [Rhipicephalus sanguineus]|uniref:uncharacterized protein LOC119402951 n=1 Tax=Rhipicephalus sanguineus TaxID=34632 RepID=UPI0020C4C6E9|nr:uncharacterized protein LOC119402951 [Rhipicephalus sanguineus]